MLRVFGDHMMANNGPSLSSDIIRYFPSPLNSEYMFDIYGLITNIIVVSVIRSVPLFDQRRIHHQRRTEFDHRLARVKRAQNSSK